MSPPIDRDSVVVVKEITFDAAHYLPKHEGKCSNLHGHTYRLQVAMRGRIDPSTGMLMDFGHLKQVMEDAIKSKLDHQLINSIPPFDTVSPTAERMVLWIRDELIPALSLTSARLLGVRLYETPTSYAEWIKED
jgi:6-pyruvoyltetrahydropterin/6-carboxytetrahydropterin synthase